MALGIPFPCEDLTYQFSFLRLQAGVFAGPGVVNTGDMVVSPSAGLQVQVSAGKAFVQQTIVNSSETAFYKGLYYSFNDAAANPYNSISAPLVNPRVDTVVLRVYDVTEQGLSGSSFQRFEWVQGTETAGANVTPGSGGYLAGIAAVPANSLVLAYVLQTVGESSILSGNILNVVSKSNNSLTPIVVPANTTAAGGQLIEYTGSGGHTVTLPSPSLKALVGVYTAGPVTGMSPLTVATPSGYIAGMGFDATSFLMGAPNACVLLLGDGTNYLIVSGQQDTGWVALTLGTGFADASTAVNIHYNGLVYAPAARLRGDRVDLRGMIDGSGASGAFTGNVPAAMKPAKTVGVNTVVWDAFGFVATSASSAALQISSTSVIASANPAPVYFSLDGLFYSLI